MSKPTIPLTPGRFYHIYNRGINSCPIFYDDVDHERFLYLYGKYVGQVADTFAWVLMRTHFHLLIRIKEDVVYRYSMEEIRRMEATQRASAGQSCHPASPPHDASGLCLGISAADTLAFAKWETMCCKDIGTRAGKTPEHLRAGLHESDFRTSRVCGKGKKTPNPSSHLGHLFNAYARYFNLKYHRHGSLFEHQFKRKPVENERYLRNAVVYIHKNPEHHGYSDNFRGYPWSSYHSFFEEQGEWIHRDEVLEWFGSAADFMMAHRTHINADAPGEWLNEE
jgi:hypothetical protein